MRRAVPLVLVVACGHGGGMPDEDLGGLVISPKEAPEAIDVDRATKDPAVRLQAAVARSGQLGGGDHPLSGLLGARPLDVE